MNHICPKCGYPYEPTPRMLLAGYKTDCCDRCYEIYSTEIQEELREMRNSHSEKRRTSE